MWSYPSSSTYPTCQKKKIKLERDIDKEISFSTNKSYENEVFSGRHFYVQGRTDSKSSAFASFLIE